LSFADRDVRVELAGRSEQAERHEIAYHYGERTRRVGRLNGVGRVLHDTEHVRRLDYQRRGPLRRLPRPRLRSHSSPLHGRSRHFGPRESQVRLQHPPVPGRNRLRDYDVGPAGYRPRHEGGLGDSGRAVVQRGVRDLHPRQLADQGLILEGRLQRPLAHLGLVRRVGCQELGPRRNVPDRRRNVMIVGSRSQERAGRVRPPVARSEAPHMGSQLHFGHRGRKVERLVAQELLGHLREQVPHGSGPHRPEHRLQVFLASGHVHVVSRNLLYPAPFPMCSAYCLAVSNDSFSDGSLSFILINHPSP